ncbi:phorbol-12-myristate-13-acetate-induced protein 1 isoform X2 [Eschrichtius robustus]|uniref:phorbol-12-myristate-13-acetate-induced protein 1 isoform X2 n=1 Tax=Eschrichtius robustus TaxID=9764 RepID=UPI0035BF7D54
MKLSTFSPTITHVFEGAVNHLPQVLRARTLGADTQLPIVAPAQKPHAKEKKASAPRSTHPAPTTVAPAPERISKPLLRGAASPASPGAHGRTRRSPETYLKHVVSSPEGFRHGVLMVMALEIAQIS